MATVIAKDAVGEQCNKQKRKAGEEKRRRERGRERRREQTPQECRFALVLKNVCVHARIIMACCTRKPGEIVVVGLKGLPQSHWGGEFPNVK